MKKLISMLLAVMMILGMSVTTMAASSVNASVDGWNGWTKTSGTAVTVADPVTGSGMVVKVSGGSAERYFARWFEGVIELSVDVYGTGSIAFNDSNGRTAGTVTLADGSINGVSCSYDADAWNTVKLFAMTGSKKTEVYLGDTLVTTIELSALVRPTKLIVSSDSDIYVDNIKISELIKTTAYADNEVETFQTSNFAGGDFSGWYADGNSTNTTAEIVTLDETKVMKLEKKSNTSGQIRFRHKLGDVERKNLVFEAELMQAEVTNELKQDSELTLYVRNYTTAGEGRALGVIGFGNDGYITIGADSISSKVYDPDPLYTLGEWFKIRVEILAENQSVILYVANSDGTWRRINTEPARLYNTESNELNADVYQSFEQFMFNLNNQSDRTGLWYLKSTKMGEVKEGKTLTLINETFDTNHSFQLNQNGNADNYLTLTANQSVGGKTGVGKLSFPKHDGSTVQLVKEGTPLKNSDNTNYTVTEDDLLGTNNKISSRSEDNDEYYSHSVNLAGTGAVELQLKYDYYDAAIARDTRSNALGNPGDTLHVKFYDGDTYIYGHTLQNTSISGKEGTYKCTESRMSSSKKTPQAWQGAIDHRADQRYQSLVTAPGNNSSTTQNMRVHANGSAWGTCPTLTSDVIQGIDEVRIFIDSNNGGIYYLDNFILTAFVPMGEGYIRKTYSAYDTYEDTITRGDLVDLELGYVEFEDANGNVSGTPTAGGKVKSVSVEKNVDVAAGAKLLVAVYEGNVLSNTEIIALTNESKYTLTKTLSTTANSVVKVFLWNNMTELIPVVEHEVVDMDNLTDLVLIGDSIVADYHANGKTDDNFGWGEKLGNYLNTNKIQIKNYAIGGATTADFLGIGNINSTEERHAAYNDAISQLDEGDYLMISLTTNDSDLEYNITSGGHIEEDYMVTGSFVANLWKMISDVKAKGATPILVTTNPRCHYIGDPINRFSVGDGYLAWVKDMERIAKQNDIPIINLYEMAVDNYDKGLASETEKYGSTTYYFNPEVRADYVSVDLTHPNENGANIAASLIAKGMAQLTCGIENFLK